MKPRGTVMRALCGAGVILLLSFTSTVLTPPGLANTELGILFASSSSLDIVKAFDLDANKILSPTTAPKSFTSPALPGVEDIACGPDGRVYAVLTGYKDHPKQIVRFKQDGTGLFTVLDIPSLPDGHPLKASGGPEGLSFEVLVQDDGQAVPAGRLTFNTRKDPGPHTGVWVIDADGTPKQVMATPAGAGVPWGEGTVYLTKGPLKRHLLGVERTDGRVVKRGPIPTPADSLVGVNFLNAPTLPQLPIGLAVDSNGDIFVSHKDSSDITRWAPTAPNTPKSAPTPPYPGFWVHIPAPAIFFFEFDAADNFYVPTCTTNCPGGVSDGKVYKVTPSRVVTALTDSNAELFTVPHGVGAAVCPRRIRAAIDIKPRSFPNPINIKSNGVIPVAILSSPSFDATSIDQNTANIRFGPKAVLSGGGGASPVRPCVPEDANDDGRLDLVCHFRQKDAGFTLGDTTGVVRWGNQDFEGEAGIITGTAGD